jgi:hypothetical protein
MKHIFGLVLWLALVIGLAIGCGKAIHYIQNPHPVSIGPHETAYVSDGDFFTLPKANITITGYDFYTLKSPQAKAMLYPEFVPPAIGEESISFIITNPPEGKYQVLRSPVVIFSEMPTTIQTEEGNFDKVIYSIGAVIVAILFFVFGTMGLGRIFFSD